MATLISPHDTPVVDRVGTLLASPGKVVVYQPDDVIVGRDVLPLATAVIEAASTTGPVVHVTGARISYSDHDDLAGFPGIHTAPSETDLTTMFRAIDTLDRAAVVILEDAEMFLTDPVSRHTIGNPAQRGLLSSLKRFDTNLTGHTLLLIATRPIDPAILDSSWTVSRPTTDTPTRTLFFSYAEQTGMLHEISVADAVRHSAGLPIRTLNQQARTNAMFTREWLITTRTSALAARSGGQWTLTNPHGDDLRLGGAPALKHILAARTGPHTLLLAGPPGTGKTTANQWVASQLGTYSLTAGPMTSSLHGQTTANIADYFTVGRQAAPCAMFIDEVETLGSRNNTGRGEAGQEDARAVGQLLTEIGPHLRPLGVTVVLASNWADRVDDALLDRADVVPLLPPTPFEAADLLIAILNHELAARATDDMPIGVIDVDPDDLARQLCAGPVRAARGRDLQRIIMQALDEPAVPVTTATLTSAYQSLRPTLPAADQLMSAIAIRACRDDRLLPWNAAAAIGWPTVIPRFLADVITVDGTVREQALDRLIAGLRILADA